MPILTEKLNFVQWLSKKQHIPEKAIVNEFAPRAWVGAYLEQGFQKLCAQAPSNVKIIPCVGEVVDLVKEKEGYQIYFQNPLGIKALPVHFHNLLFCTGHFGNFDPHSLPNNTRIISRVYPVEEALKELGAMDTVAIKGFGLTFIDVVLALTEGRGGIFEKNEEGELYYIPSGNEPKKILAFSRSGLPIIPRTGQKPPEFPLHYFNREILEYMGMGSMQFDFEEQLLPLIKNKMVFAYYDRLLSNYGDQLVYHYDFSIVEKQINAFHMEYPQLSEFTFESLERPISSGGEENWEIQLLPYIRYTIEEAQMGLEKSPLLASIGVFKGISELLNECYSYGGLTPASHRIFDEYYRGLFNRIGHGPPIINLQKILVLADCNILDLSFCKSPLVIACPENSGFIIKKQEESSSFHCTHLLEATIPKTNIEKNPSLLYKNMLQRGMIQPFVNGGSEPYNPGCLAVDRESHPLNTNGHPYHNITFYGTPLEGINFDNDTLSRKRNNTVSAWAEKTINEIKTLKLSKNEV